MILWWACAGEPSPEAEPAPAVEALDVVTLSFPAHWLAERIGGDDVDARCLLPPGEDPPDWRPEPAAIAGLAEADLIVANGAGYEAWTKTAALPRGRFVDTAAGLSLIEREVRAHSHGVKGEHSHGAVDPHTWSDPALYLRQAGAVAAALVRAAPAREAAFSERLAGLRAELEAVDGELEAALAPWSEVAIAASHPAFDYLARRYGLTVRSLDLDPAEPVTEVIPEPWLWWEAAPNAAVRASVKGPEQLVLDPLEQPVGGRYDWLAGARRNVEALSAGPS